jgi:hypothetical protein
MNIGRDRQNLRAIDGNIRRRGGQKWFKSDALFAEEEPVLFCYPCMKS